MTYREWMTLGMERLQAAGIEEASLDAWYLLERHPASAVPGIISYRRIPSRKRRQRSFRSFWQRESGAFLCSRSWVIQSLWD